MRSASPSPTISPTPSLPVPPSPHPPLTPSPSSRTLPFAPWCRWKSRLLLLFWLVLLTAALSLGLTGQAGLGVLLGLFGALGVWWELAQLRLFRQPFCIITDAGLTLPRHWGSALSLPWPALRGLSPNRSLLPDAVYLDYEDVAGVRRVHPCFFRECAEPAEFLTAICTRMTHGCADRSIGRLLQRYRRQGVNPWDEVGKRRW